MRYPRSRHRSANKLEALLGDSGIDNNTTIVLYGDNNNWFAAWAFWQLKIYGHEDVRIMDGGRKKWLAEGRDLSTSKPTFHEATYTGEGRRHLAARVPAGSAGRSERKEGGARRRAQPAGVHRRDPGAPRACPRRASVAAIFPGAKSIPWGKAATTMGRSRVSTSLRRCMRAQGVTGDQPVIAYCRIGERSSLLGSR